MKDNKIPWHIGKCMRKSTLFFIPFWEEETFNEQYDMSQFTFEDAYAHNVALVKQVNMKPVYLNVPSHKKSDNFIQGTIIDMVGHLFEDVIPYVHSFFNLSKNFKLDLVDILLPNSNKIKKAWILYIPKSFKKKYTQEGFTNIHNVNKEVSKTWQKLRKSN